MIEFPGYDTPVTPKCNNIQALCDLPENKDLTLAEFCTKYFPGIPPCCVERERRKQEREKDNERNDH